MCALKSPMSKVLPNSSLSGFFGNQKVWGGGGGLLSQLFAPAPPPTPHMFLADKCGETFDLVVNVFIY